MGSRTKNDGTYVRGGFPNLTRRLSVVVIYNIGSITAECGFGKMDTS